MKIGMCGSILSDLYEKAAAAGFDYFECSFSDMAVRPEADVLAAEEKIAKIGLPVLGANGLLKGGIAVVAESYARRGTAGIFDPWFFRYAAAGGKTGCIRLRYGAQNTGGL